MSKHRSPRVATPALILHQGRLLLVNAYPGGRSDLWCAPGGGAEPGQSLPTNLMREVMEETGLTVAVGDPEAIVTQRRFFARDDLELGRLRFKPDSLPTAAWGGEGLLYDPLERLIR